MMLWRSFYILTTVFVVLVSAWSKEDREIFRVRDELALHEGSNVTFYDFLGLVPSATQDDITKAYRQKTKHLHPDKVRQQLRSQHAKGDKKSKPLSQAEIKAAIKKAGDRQARLSIVANVLRGPGRDRYDHFLKHGFPAWKGTEYYYSRYRPGVATVLIGVFIVAGGGVHYLAQYLRWMRQREFVERYIKFARDTARGDGLGIPGVGSDIGTPAPVPAAGVDANEAVQGPLNRRMRRMQERENKKDSSGSGKRQVPRRRAPVANPSPSDSGAGPQLAKKRVVAENGKILVVDSLGDVYLEQEDEDGNVQEYLLDPEEIACPTFRDTAVYRLPVFLFNTTVGRFLQKPNNAAEEESTSADISSDALIPRSENSSSDDFELVEKCVDDLAQVKSSAVEGRPSSSRKRTKKAGRK